MEKILLTVIVFLLAGFIIATEDVSKGLKIFLIVCLIVTEILIITLL